MMTDDSSLQATMDPRPQRRREVDVIATLGGVSRRAAYLRRIGWKGFVDGNLGREEAAKQIATNYRRFIDVYNGA